MAENLNRQRILDYVKACYVGEIERAASYYDDEIDFIAYAPIDVFPTLGRKFGKAAMTESLVKFRATYDPIDYKVTSVVAEDDRVALALALRLPLRNGDRVITTHFASFYTLRKGRIHIYRQFMDSLDAVQQKLQWDLADELRRGALVQR